jgi:hypothetical protein
MTETTKSGGNVLLTAITKVVVDLTFSKSTKVRERTLCMQLASFRVFLAKT